jgi:hypothetical protein
MPSNAPPWPPLDEQGHIVLPDDPDERVHLARRVFGRVLVQAMDYYINLATDWAANPLPAEPYEFENYATERDRAYRACFASMSDKQREITLHMIRRFLDGVLMSSLTALDQFWKSDVKISLIGKVPDGQQVEVPITAVDADLAAQFVECSEEFSEHAVQLAEDLKLPPQW